MARKFKKLVKFNPAISDQIGMLFTAINALVLADFLRRCGARAVVMSRFLTTFTRTYNCYCARAALNQGEIVILAGGSGISGFSTDTAAVLYARELGASIVLKGTTVAGVFNADPEHDSGARLIEKVSCRDFLNRNLGPILDRSAVVLAEQYGLPIRVFDFQDPNGLNLAITGNSIGTLVHP